VTACAGWFALARRHAPVLNGAPRFAWSRLLPLLRFGGWMSVTNTVGPLLVYADRFLIGGLLSMTAVTAYTTPWEIATRVLVVASPVAVVLFPSFTMAWSADRDRLGRLFDAGWRAVWLLVFPAVFALAALTPELLQRWVGPDLASRSAPVLRWLAAGVLLNGIGQIALGLVQGTGHPQWSARLHVLEVPAYAAALVALVLARGIEGAAMAWTARVAVDSAALFLMTRRLLPDRRPGPGPVAAAVIGVGAIGLVSMPMPLAPRLALAALVAAACVMAGLRLARPLLSAALGRGTPR
jgi:O-antigen/teichoic acid export membrane protein